MATYTPNLNLIKPAGTDYVRVSDFNENANVLDASIGDLGQLTTDAKASLVLAINEAALRGGENAPYIGENGNWFQWNATLAQYEDTEVPAEGPAGPPNALTIGSVQSGTTANATITGTAPEQTLNLVLPKGDTGAAGPDGVSGVYLGETEPTDPDVNVWIDPTGGFDIIPPMTQSEYDAIPPEDIDNDVLYVVVPDEV